MRNPGDDITAVSFRPDLSPTCRRLVADLTCIPLTGVCEGVDLASPSIKRNLNICQGTIDDAVGLFQNITNATLIILENGSTM